MQLLQSIILLLEMKGLKYLHKDLVMYGRQVAALMEIGLAIRLIIFNQLEYKVEPVQPLVGHNLHIKDL